MEPQKEPKAASVKKQTGVRFATHFTSSKGNVFYARDYGHEAWPIRSRSGSARREQKKGR